MMDVPAPTEPDPIAYMTDVELETFARTVVAERDALAAALECTRTDNEELRAELEMVGQTTLGTALVLANEALAELDEAQAERDAARAELAAERAKAEHAHRIALDMIAERDELREQVASVRWVCEKASGDGNHINGVSVVPVPHVLAALAAAQPTGETPCEHEWTVKDRAGEARVECAKCGEWSK